MLNKPFNIAILGAGISGLTAALQINNARLNRVHIITIYESKPIPGGLFRSTSHEGYNWDNGLFKFTNNNMLYQLFPEMFEEIYDFSQKVIVDNKIMDFPFRRQQLIEIKPSREFCLFSYKLILAKLSRLVKSDRRNLYAWLINRLTAPILAKSGLENYILKIQGLEATEVSTIFALERLMHIDNNSKISKLAIQKLTPRKQTTKNPILVARPEMGGVGGILGKLVELCQNNGIEIQYNTDISRIINRNNNGYILKNHKTQDCMASCILSTIPLEETAKICGHPKENRCGYNVGSMQTMNMLLAFYVINKSKIRNDHFILYSFDIKHFWKRLVARSIGKNKCTIIVEATYNPNQPIDCNTIVDNITESLVNDIKLFDKEDIILMHKDVIKNAYPIYRNGFDKYSKFLLNSLESESFQLAGRQGRFYYCSTLDSMKTANEAAQNIINYMKTLN